MIYIFVIIDKRMLHCPNISPNKWITNINISRKNKSKTKPTIHAITKIVLYTILNQAQKRKKTIWAKVNRCIFNSKFNFPPLLRIRFSFSIERFKNQ